MTPEICAQIHARAFAETARPWSAAEFRQLIDSPYSVFTHSEHGFALARVVADEAELLTIATDPHHQGQGQGRDALRALEHACAMRGARRIFLEVAADNHPAIQLYLTQNYQHSGTRAGYYTHGHRAVDAILMQKALKPATSR